jgi:sulfide dehydrogenase cytochrome subunit
MKVMKVFQICTTLMSLVLLTPLQAADVAALKVVCESCHGQGGVSLTSSVPTIAGQAYTLIEDNLLAYRVNERPCSAGPPSDNGPLVPPSPMCAIASTLDDEAIAVLAEYYEQQEFVPAKQGFDKSLASRGEELHHQANCESCHSGGGRISNGMAAILAGQWTPYLEIAFHQIRTGERMGPKVMNNAIQLFSDDDIQALLNYYASRRE